MGKWKKPRDRYKIKKRPVDEDTAGDGAEPNKQVGANVPDRDLRPRAGDWEPLSAFFV